MIETREVECVNCGAPLPYEEDQKTYKCQYCGSTTMVAPSQEEEDSGKKETPLVVTAAKCHSDSDCSTGEVCDNASGSCIPYAPEGEQWYEKWWFWTIVGGGLAVAGGTTLLVWYLLQPDVGAIEFTF